LALEAWGAGHEIFWFDDDGIERFAALVRADERDRAMRENAYVRAEREACAKVCDEESAPQHGEIHSDAQWAAKILAGKIRARGQA